MDRDKLINYILRAVECLFAIVSFATLADFGGSGSKYGYVLFTGISTLILTLGFMLCYAFNAEQSKTFRTFEFGVNLIWLVFWFAAAIVTSTFNQGFSQLAASCAFAWLTFIVWAVSCVMSGMAMRGKVSMPAAPQSNVV